MKDFKFIGTDLLASELTAWILQLDTNKRITEIRYYGSRVFGKPRPDSDIDVYLLLEEEQNDDTDEDDDAFSLGPLFSKKYKGHRIEFHPMIDFYDGYVPSYLKDTTNQIQKTD